MISPMQLLTSKTESRKELSIENKYMMKSNLHLKKNTEMNSKSLKFIVKRRLITKYRINTLLVCKISEFGYKVK